MKEKAMQILSYFLHGGIRELEEKLNVTIRFIDFEFFGCCFARDGNAEIWINRNLDRETQLKVLFHEIYHLLYDADSLYQTPLYRRNEYRANYFANLIIQNLKGMCHEI